MNLFVHLILRLAGVVLLCLVCAVGWVLIDAHRAIEKEATASADRVAGALETLYWRELLWRGGLNRDHLMPIPEWETMATMKVHLAGRLHHLRARQGSRRGACAASSRRSAIRRRPGSSPSMTMSSAAMPGSNGP